MYPIFDARNDGSGFVGVVAVWPRRIAKGYRLDVASQKVRDATTRLGRGLKESSATPPSETSTMG